MMNQNNPIAMLINQAIQKNPNLQNIPQAQNYIQVLRSGDAQQGRQLAENICKSMGVTPEQAIQQAKQFFGFR